MKRSLLSVLLLMMLSVPQSYGQGSLRPRGDVNCDWEVNIADVNALVDTIITDARYHSFYGYAADVNGDKEYTIADLNLLTDAILGGELEPMPTFSGTLPVFYIITDEYHAINSKENYLYALGWIDAMGVEGYQSLGSESSPLWMQIKGRGNYTWTNLDKKGLRIRLLETKQELLGMPASRHWVLLANAEYWMGPAYDALPFEIGRRMGMAWNSHQVPVEVVLNGQYIGMYFLTEKIDVDKDRVNIAKQNDLETDSTKVTGGWLLEIDNYYEADHIEFTEGNGWAFWASLHSPEKLSRVQRDYMTNFLIQADSAIYNPDKSSEEWEKYIDMDSLAVFYIIQEIVDNPESFSGSCYVHKQFGDSTKLIFGPLWDFGSSFVRYSPTYQFDHFIYDQPPSYVHQRWIAEIAKFPRFQECVRKHWKHFYEDIYPTVDQFLDELAAQVEVAGNYDHIRWPQYYGHNTKWRINSTYKIYLHQKVAWLQTQWGDSIEVRSEKLEESN